MKRKKGIGLLLSFVMLMGLMPQLEVRAVKEPFRDITTTELVNDMGIGINLGNTLESTGDWIVAWGDGTPNAYETGWGSPTITREIIQGYADEGFGTLRIPVAWSNMMTDDGTYTINPDYMARVQEVVNWTLDADMYVILNLHWDGGWLEKLPESPELVMHKYEVIWEQVADAFKEYGDHLIFESQNEELGWSSLWNQWSGTDTNKKLSYDYVNQVNQKFVNLVRSSGGNNDKRHLLISGYNTDIKLTSDSLFVMPDDPANRCAISVHYYTPAGFAILEEDADWGKASATWGTEAEYKELNQLFDTLDERYASKGIPVIVGEYGCPKKNKEPESVRRFLSAVCEAALSRGGICPVLWDVTDLHYDRTACKLKDQMLREQLVALRDKYVPEQNTRVQGDVNADKRFTIADVVALQKWLLAVPDADLADWKAGDFYEDDQLNAFDFCLMKQTLMAAS